MTRLKHPTNKDKKQAFLFYWHIFQPGAPEPTGKPEHRFAAKSDYKRQWQFDWAWIDERVAVEVDGGTHLVVRGVAVGSHAQDDDYLKINAANDLGWRVFRITTSMLKNGKITEQFCAQVRRAIGDNHE